MDNQKITSPDMRKYRTELPNLVDDMGLNPYEFRLLAHYYRVGECWESTKTTAEKCKMSTGQVSETRRSLQGKGLIVIDEEKKDSLSIQVVDIWAKNFAAFTKRTPVSPDEPASSPGETKKEPVKKNLIKNLNHSADPVYENIDTEGNPEPKKKPTKRQRETVPAETFRPMVLAIGEVMRWDMQIRSNWAVIDKKAKELILAGYTPENVRTAFGAGSRWYAEAWQAKGNKPPNMRNISEYIGEYSGRVVSTGKPKYNAEEAKRLAQEAMRGA